LDRGRDPAAIRPAYVLAFAQCGRAARPAPATHCAGFARPLLPVSCRIAPDAAPDVCYGACGHCGCPNRTWFPGRVHGWTGNNRHLVPRPKGEVMTAAEYIDKNRDRFRNELFDFLRIPSVSARSEHRADTRRAAEWLMARMKDAGLEVSLHETAGHPIVLGEWRGAGPSAPTVL